MELYSAWKEDQQQRSKGMKKYLLLIIRNLNSYHIILNYIKFFFTIFNTTLFSFHLCKKPIFSPRRHTSLFSTQRGTFLWTRATVKFSVFNVTLQENSSFLYLDIAALNFDQTLRIEDKFISSPREDKMVKHPIVHPIFSSIQGRLVRKEIVSFRNFRTRIEIGDRGKGEFRFYVSIIWINFLKLEMKKKFQNLWILKKSSLISLLRVNTRIAELCSLGGMYRVKSFLGTNLPDWLNERSSAKRGGGLREQVLYSENRVGYVKHVCPSDKFRTNEASTVSNGITARKFLNFFPTFQPLPHICALRKFGKFWMEIRNFSR